MAKAYHHVTRDARCQIKALKASGCSLRFIAKHLGFNVSTISREIQRNKGKKGYRIDQADRKAKERRSAASKAAKKMTPLLLDRIKAARAKKWSPEQMMLRFRLGGIFISHESIYRFVWADKRAGGFLYKHLLHNGKRYNKRSSGKARRGCIPGRVDISERPKIVESKSRIGDWEGDTIIGAKQQGTILSVVDRKSKFTLLKSIVYKQSALVLQAMIEKMGSLTHPVHTITFDNGKEFAQHKEISKALKALCFFAQPYHSWERGLNEHTNRLVRQYLPKSTNLSEVTDELIEQIQDSLNHRPRKSLGGRTPYEVFFGKENTEDLPLCC